MTRFSILLPLAVAPFFAACSSDAEATGPGSVDPPADAAEEAEPEGFTRETLLKLMSVAEVDALEGERGVTLHEPGAFEGVTLTAPLNSTQAHLLDMQGEILHTWETNLAPGGWSYLQEDGTLLHCGRDDEDPKFRGGGIGGYITRFAPDGKVLWRADVADEGRHQHHDIAPMPNGNMLFIQWERKSAEEAIARGRHPEGVGAVGIWPDAVIEIEPFGTDGARVVWEWHAWDHLVQDVDPAKPNYGVIAEHPGRIDVNYDFEPEEVITEEEKAAQEELERQMAAMGYAGGEEEEEDEDDEPEEQGSRYDRSGDWMHTNAVAYHPELDLIALSSPQMGEIFVIDHSTTTEEAAGSTGGRYGKGGDILWRWGNPATHGAGGESDQRLFYQHDPTWIGGADDLRLLVFNNGGRRPDGSNFSEVLELALPFDAEQGFTCDPGAACGPAEAVWSYAEPDTFFSAFISGAERLPNGNTLICSGVGGHVFEVTPEGQVVWDYSNTLGGDIEPPDHAGNSPPLALFRAHRYAMDHPGVRSVLD